MNIDKQYFFGEVHKFRKMMCSTEYMGSLDGLEKLSNAFTGLATVYAQSIMFHVGDDESLDLIQSTMEATKYEYKRRLEYTLIGA